MSLSRDEFVQRVVASGLMSASELESLLQSTWGDRAEANAERIGELLVERNKLTRYQVEQIVAGNGQSLVLGNYVVLDQLGQGGMGVVLKAKHRRMDRIVALKVISAAAMKSPEAVQRFHREVRAAAKLEHPNVVAAYDADEANGIHFLVMQFVDGIDLSSWVKRHGPMRMPPAVACIRQAALALDYAHSLGVIHRDIKPANLLIDARGTVRVLDLGLARIEGVLGDNPEAVALTESGAIMGTVDYMSPEQAMDTRQANALSDIYSLGCTMYYLLTGNVVYGSDTAMKRLMAHQNAPIPSLVNVLRSPDSGLLDSLFRSMIAKRPQDRPSSMAEVIQRLDKVMAEGGVTETALHGGTAAVGSKLPQPSAERASSGILQAEIAAAKSAAVSDSELSDTHVSAVTEAQTPTQVFKGSKAEDLRRSAAPVPGRRLKRTLWGVVVLCVVMAIVVVIATRKRSVDRVLSKAPRETGVQKMNDRAEKSSIPPVPPATEQVSEATDFRLEFDGVSSRVNIPELSYKGADPITLEATIRLANAERQRGRLMSFPWGGLSVDPVGILVMRCWDPAVQKRAVEIRNSEPIALERDYRLAFSFDGENYRLFLDGKVVAEKKDEPVVDTSTQTGFFLGAYGQRIVILPFRGTMDEIRVSSIARYQNDYSLEPILPLDKDTLALYHCNEGEGDVLMDSSDNHFDGEILGATWSHH